MIAAAVDAFHARGFRAYTIKEIVERANKMCCDSLVGIHSVWSFFDNWRFSTTPLAVQLAG
jgi:hypothetical protein